MSLERRTPMKRTGGPKADPAKARDWQDRSRQRLPRESANGAERRKRATAAGKAAKARDQQRCVARPLVVEVRCWGPLDPQHVIPRGVRPDMADDEANIIGCCRGHHDWIGDHPTKARELGLHGRDGDDLAELAQRRTQAR